MRKVLSKLVLAASSLFYLAYGRCIRSEDCVSEDVLSACSTSLCTPFQIVTPNMTYMDFVDEVNQQNLSAMDRKKILNITSRTLAELNPHRALHRAYLGVDAVKEIRSLPASILSVPVFDFHASIMKIFRKMNDRHTMYSPPAPFRNSFTVLGFVIRAYYKRPDSPPRFVVVDILPGFSFPLEQFKVGVDVLQVDGLPVEEVAIRLGRSGYGANRPAQFARGVEALSVRSTIESVLPTASEIDIRFRAADGAVVSMMVPWVFVSIGSSMIQAQARNQFHNDVHMMMNNRRESGAMPKPMPNPKPNQPTVLSRTPITVKSPFENLFFAEIVKTTSGQIGHLILPSFGKSASPDLQKELVRVLHLLPQSGLVLDVRGNLGGAPDYVKLVTALTSNVTINPLPEQIRASKLFFKLATDKRAKPIGKAFVSRYKTALRDFRRIGDYFTGPVGDVFTLVSQPLRRPKQVYTGPVISLTDARTYSAGDLFAVVQKDLGASYVIGMDETTGGGGAAGVSYDILRELFPTTIRQNMPGEVGFSTAFSRYFRTGAEAGGLVERFGVEPDERYFLTRGDVLEDSVDLFDYVGEKLKGMRIAKREM